MSEIQKAQSWQDCDTDIKEFVNELVAKVHSELGDNLVGIYLHGSLAMGGYYRQKAILMSLLSSMISSLKVSGKVLRSSLPNTPKLDQLRVMLS